MLFLKSWLQDYIDLSSIHNQTLIDKITSKSSEVDDFDIVQDYFDQKVVIGQIKNVRKHPDADKLNIFEMDLGSELAPVTIVSAAPNVRENLIVPVALIDSKLPMFTITERKLRGVASNGMCLGQSELGLETGYSPGLWELSELLDGQNLPDVLGQSICKILPQYFPHDVVIDIKVLPNKIASIGSHLGMALEIISCLEDKTLLTPLAIELLNPNIKPQLLETSDLKINVEDLTGKYVRDFDLYSLDLQDKEYHLPHKIITRLFLLNQNLTGTIADLSNYLLLDVGQPSHFFDAEKLAF